MGTESKYELALKLLVTRSRTFWLCFHNPLPLMPSHLLWIGKAHSSLSSPFGLLSLRLFVSSSLLVLSVSLSFLLVTLPWADGRLPHASSVLSLPLGALLRTRHHFSSGLPFPLSVGFRRSLQAPTQDQPLAHDEKGVLCSSELMHQGQSLMTKA